MTTNIQSKLSKLKEIVELFRANIQQYKSGNYDEANTRVDFIDKFFELLDWDVRNEQGFSEQYRDVVREDKVQIEGKQKAPDYSFRIGGVRKFFVEAKKPSVNIKEETTPAFQVRRYAYTAKLPLSILTDFEEFAVYDTRIKPNKEDKASVGRIFYCTYTEYEKHFEFIYNTFSKPAILKGSFDRYIEENKNKKGTSEVDKELLNLIEDWRTELAKNIALRNPNLDIYNLNLAVQKIIDRIIFLRIAEDKEIENYGRLLGLLSSSLKDIYKPLDEIFKKAYEKYNSDLFEPTQWISELQIDSKVLSNIIQGLYYPDCPYEFSVLPVEILGSIYEQFLGKTIQFRNVKGGHTAIIEEKPEVRKAGGVYYTPQYIVNYIVENTLGAIIRTETAGSQEESSLKETKLGLSPEEISKLKICDPACGSGSFLVGAYEYLLNYHLEYYTHARNVQKALKDKKIYQYGENSYKLTLSEKQNILVNNIYGVDIDPQAVEVTKLSLYLKLLENEGREWEGFLFKQSDFKLLPKLDQNIQCGNSLISEDFYVHKDMSLFGIEEMRKINAFDWKKKFPEVFQNGGFDVIIGNPPYGAELSEQERRYLENSFQLNNTDTACLFIGLYERLLKSNGILGYIIPKPFLYASNWKKVRQKVLDSLLEVVDCGKVWKEVKLEQIILILKKANNLTFYYSGVRRKENIEKIGEIQKYTFQQFGFYLNGISSRELQIGEKVQKVGSFLNDYCTNQRGAVYQKDVVTTISDYKVLGGKQVSRYFLTGDTKGYISKEIVKDEKAFIKDNSILVQRIVAHIENPIPHIKIIATSPYNFINKEEYIIVDTINQLSFLSEWNSLFFLAILNSKLISWFCYRFIFGMAIRTMQFDNPVTSRIPIPKLDLTDKKQKAQHDLMISLVTQMLEAQKLAHNVQTESDKAFYKQRIEILDKQIDQLVYELYGLTEEEIGLLQ